MTSAIEVPDYQEVGRIQAMSGEIRTEAVPAARVWRAMAEISMRHHVTMIATYNSDDVTTIRTHGWIDDRPSYAMTSSRATFWNATKRLAEELDADTAEIDTLPLDTMRVVMGRRSGYEHRGRLDPISSFQTAELRHTGLTVQPTRLLYAGFITDMRRRNYRSGDRRYTAFDPYRGDHMALLEAERTDEAVQKIHELAFRKKQYFYTIEHELPGRFRPYSVSYAGRPALLEEAAAPRNPLFKEERARLVRPLLRVLAHVPSGIELRTLSPLAQSVIQDLVDTRYVVMQTSRHKPHRLTPISPDQPYVQLSTLALQGEARQGLEPMCRRILALNREDADTSEKIPPTSLIARRHPV